MLNPLKHKTAKPIAALFALVAAAVALTGSTASAHISVAKQRALLHCAPIQNTLRGMKADPFLGCFGDGWYQSAQNPKFDVYVKHGVAVAKKPALARLPDIKMHNLPPRHKIAAVLPTHKSPAAVLNVQNVANCDGPNFGILNPLFGLHSYTCDVSQYARFHGGGFAAPAAPAAASAAGHVGHHGGPC
jgi:hypothetical protein